MRRESLFSSSPFFRKEKKIRRNKFDISLLRVGFPGKEEKSRRCRASSQSVNAYAHLVRESLTFQSPICGWKNSAEVASWDGKEFLRRCLQASKDLSESRTPFANFWNSSFSSLPCLSVCLSVSLSGRALEPFEWPLWRPLVAQFEGGGESRFRSLLPGRHHPRGQRELFQQRAESGSEPGNAGEDLTYGLCALFLDAATWVVRVLRARRLGARVNWTHLEEGSCFSVYTMFQIITTTTIITIVVVVVIIIISCTGQRGWGKIFQGLWDSPIELFLLQISHFSWPKGYIRPDSKEQKKRGGHTQEKHLLGKL